MKRLLLLLLLSASAASAAPRDDRERLNYLAYSAKLVVVAEVLRVEEPPGHEGKPGARVQDVRYRVVEVLKGETTSGEFSVGYALDFGVPFVDFKESRLSPQQFAPGRRHVLFLKADPATRPLDKSRVDGKLERYLSPDDHYGLAAADAETVRHLQLFISGALPEDHARLQRSAGEAEIVVVAEVIGVQPSLNFWSGFARSTQSVDYRVIEVLKGELKYPELRVEFLLFQENPFVNPFEPRLLPEVFKAGNRQVHFLKRGGQEVYFDNNRGRFEFFSSFDHIWSAPTTPDTVNRIRQLVLTKQNAKR
ncbi:MAG TPA: hypothetical protein VF543_19290 [Pyrinomonadaceae bacterium]|jgi:hypothetical protein